MCLLARCYTAFLESVISHPSFKLHTMIAMYVTHISNELEPIKGVCYGQIGTYVRVHVLFITNDVTYITYFKEKILPTLSHTFLYNSIMFKS